MTRQKIEDAMKERGFTLERYSRKGHPMWRHDATGKLITLSRAFQYPEWMLDAYINKMMAGTHDANYHRRIETGKFKGYS